MLVPGTDVLLAEPDLPVKAGVKLQQLVPYALEEHLADSIDDLHFAIGKRAGQSARVPVAVVARALLNEWLATLRAAGISADAMYADSDLLPENPGQAVVLLEEDAVFVRPPGGNVVTLPADALAQGLEIAQSDSGHRQRRPRPDPLHRRGGVAADTPRRSRPCAAASTASRSSCSPAGRWRCSRSSCPRVIRSTCCRGTTPRRAPRRRAGRPGGSPRSCSAGLITLHVLGKAVQLHFLKAREHQVEASIVSTARSVLPDAVSATDARRRLEQRLVQYRGAGSGLLRGAAGARAGARRKPRARHWSR